MIANANLLSLSSGNHTLVLECFYSPEDRELQSAYVDTMSGTMGTAGIVLPCDYTSIMTKVYWGI